MFRLGNTKLGNLIHHWSIPSGLEKICVGATALCLSLCYAMRHHYLRKNVKTALARNFNLAIREDFHELAIGWIKSLFCRVVRVHPSGEFFSTSYVKQWIKVAKASPKVTFFAYTRSWRDKDVLRELKKLAREPNFYLWFSCDKDTGKPPKVKGVRFAYLMYDDNDIPSFKVDLVFRNKTRQKMKWVNGTLVCPEENGVTDITCSKCKLCFNERPIPRNDRRSKKQPVLSFG